MTNPSSLIQDKKVGYFGKIEERLKAQKLRRKGYSYKEILQKINVPKDTLSRWCRNIPLSKDQQKRLLENKLLGQRKGSLIAAENKKKDRIKRTLKILKKGKEEIGVLSKRDGFIAGLALYAAEGDKSEIKSGFANSDPNIIAFMMRWFKEFCNVPTSKFRGAIWLHEGLNEKKAREYWSDLTGIPLKQFHKTYIAKDRKTSRKIRKRLYNFGVFSIRFNDAKTQRKILGWIYGLLNVKISSRNYVH